MSEHVSQVLSAQRLFDQTVWLRFDHMDRLLPCLQHSLTIALGRLGEAVSTAWRSGTSELGDSSLRQTGRVLAMCVPPGTALVLEDPEAALAERALELLEGYVEEGPVGPAILICHRSLRRRYLRVPDLVLGRQELGPPNGPVRSVFHRDDLRMDLSMLARLMGIARRRPALAYDILDAALVRNDTVVTQVIRQRPFDLADRLTERLLMGCSAAELHVLMTASETGYFRSTESLGTDPRTLRPWLVPLENRWFWVRPVWRRSLRRHLGRIARGSLGIRIAELGPAPPAPPDVTWVPTPAIAAAPVLETAIVVSDPRGTPSPAQAADPDPQPTLRVRFLGPFEVAIDTCWVNEWKGHRAPMLLKYLLAQPSHSSQRDLLLDVFWEDVDPDLARKRLHVAITAIRRRFRTVTDVPIVEFHEGSYRINPSFQVITDVDEFEHLTREGARLENIGDNEGAITALDDAVAVYRGHFLPETPYEEWTLFTREMLRLAYLDALDRLANLCSRTEQIDRCVEACQLILREDPSREDAHRLLMRSYVLQGRPHQAIRQFEICRTTMQNYLGLSVSRASLELLRTIEVSVHETPSIDT